MRRERQLLPKIGILALLTAILLVSRLFLADYVSSPERHAASIAALDEQKVTVMELTAATAATSVAVSAIPGDATTPVANQISELSSYLLLAVGAIMLEKVLLTLTGYVTFAFLIPAACILGGIALFRFRSLLLPLAVKLTVFGLAICLVIPASIRVGNLVEETFAVQQTIDEAQRAADKAEEEAGAITEEEETNSLGGWLSQIGEQITSGVSGVIAQAESALSSFVDAIAALLIVNCVIPLLVLWFFLKLTKIIWDIDLPVSKVTGLVKRRKTPAVPEPEHPTSLVP